MRTLILIIGMLMFTVRGYADQWPSGDREFISELNVIKNPFENGIPKPIAAPIKSVSLSNASHPEVQHRQQLRPKKPVEEILLPQLELEGVMVGEGVNYAIINDQVVNLKGRIKGARLIAVNKNGIVLLYRGKKFSLKVE